MEPLQRNRVRRKKQTRAEGEQPQEQNRLYRRQNNEIAQELHLLAVLCNVYLQQLHFLRKVLYIQQFECNMMATET